MDVARKKQHLLQQAVQLIGRDGLSESLGVTQTTLDAWVRAIDHDEREDVTFAERTREAGDVLEVTRGRRTGWVLFRDVDLTGVRHLELEVAQGGSVRLEVRDGRGWGSVRTVDVPDGGRYAWSTVQVRVPPAGVTDLRLVLAGPVRLAALRGRR